MQNNNPEDQRLEELILEGFVEVAAMDMATGEMLYAFTEKAKEEIPDVYRRAEEFFNQMIMFFWEQGFVSMDIDSLNPSVTITPKALDQEEVSKLSYEHQQALRIILEALRISD